ncbi:hypothetical protein [Nocardioides sp. Root190]|nr:hypothetical protein [Nocardioides sp. Root190]
MTTADLDHARRLAHAERRWLAEARDRLRTTRPRPEQAQVPTDARSAR